MVDGTMTFTVDNGRGPITAIFKPDSRFQFCDGNWHEIHGKTNFTILCDLYITFVMKMISLILIRSQLKYFATVVTLPNL